MSLHSNSKSDSQSMWACEINFTPQCLTASVVCVHACEVTVSIKLFCGYTWFVGIRVNCVLQVCYFFNSQVCILLIIRNILKAGFRWKYTALLLPSLLCYLLPIDCTLAHCSLAFCQTWFLTPASALPTSSCTVTQHLLFPTCVFLSFPSVPCVCVWFHGDVEQFL